MKEGFKCVLCGKRALGWGPHKQYGNNPAPLAKKGECCNECNKEVILARLRAVKESKQ